jgi:hypothetical protein
MGLFDLVEFPLIPNLLNYRITIHAEPLLDLTCLQVSCTLMGKTAEEIRVMLNIPKLTPEEEARARQQHRWIFDD